MGLDKIVGGCIGLGFFLILCGYQILQPQYISWLLDNTNHDSIQHFVGWEFFRNEAWHFPLGLITNYGYPIATSIVYTDSIPILALIFKLSAPLLPHDFQYFGLWFALCLFLQGWFAWGLCNYFTKNIVIKTLITGFFVMSPIMQNRMVEHQALVGHWIILASFYLYLRPLQRTTHIYWLVLNAFAILIHAYLALMCLSVWLAFLLREIVINKNIKLGNGFRIISLNLFILIILAYVSGYFVIPFSGILDAGGYSFNSLNLLAPLQPTSGSFIAPNHWSRFLTPLTTTYIEQGDEGFNYFGLGFISLSIIAIFCFLATKNYKITFKTWMPLIIVISLLAIYALSNNIYFGNKLLFSYPLPKFLIEFTDIFRAPGRFFWPMYYFLMLGIFMILVNKIPMRALLPVLFLGLSLQIWDLSPKFVELHQRFSENLTLNSKPLNIPEINNPKLAHLVFLPFVSKPHIKIKNFGNYLHYAATHNLTVNLGYLARQNQSNSYAINRKVMIDLYQGKYSPDTLYLVTDPRWFNKLKAHSARENTFRLA